MQPASLKGHSSMAVLQLSFRCVGTSSRAMLGVPHWLGQGTGYRGHWYWWFWGQRLGVIGVERRRGRPPPRGPVSPGWCRTQTPWRSRCRAGCAWGTQTGCAGTAGAASCAPHTCSHSTRFPGDMFPGGPGDRASMVTASSLPTARLRPAGCPPPSLSPCAVLCMAGTIPTARLCPQQQDGPICALQPNHILRGHRNPTLQPHTPLPTPPHPIPAHPP